jgi:hypothetical protein
MKSDDNTPNAPAITRRAALTGATAIGIGALPGLGATASAAPLPRASGLELPLTPEDNLSNLIRMSASLDPVDTPWFFNGSVYAVVGDQAPVELMRSEGLEIYNMQRLGPASFVMHGLTATFYTDAESGQVLREFENPYTGEVVDVSPNAARTPPGGGHVYGTDGVRPRSAMNDIPDKTLDLWWTAAGDFVWLHNETVYPPGLPQPRKQRQSNFVRMEEFADPAVRSLSAAFTVTFWSPWSSWLGMEGTPGHLVWHASGAKLNSVDDLPAHFRSRMEAEHPDMLAVKIR